MKCFFSLFLTGLIILVLIESFVLKPDLNPQRNSITVKLTDSPANYAALYVEILEVSIYGEENGWITISNQSQYINILALTNGTEIELAQVFALPDVYTRMMIRFGHENILYLYGNRTSDDKVPTISKTMGWKGMRDIYIPIYQQIPGDGSEILLDFDVAESIIKEQDGYFLQPVVKLLENKSTGISGHVEGTPMVLIEMKNEQNSYSAFADMNGDFLIRGIEPGVYDITITANFIGYETNPSYKKTSYHINIILGDMKDLNPIVF